jgi:hypothetical protein
MQTVHDGIWGHSYLVSGGKYSVRILCSSQELIQATGPCQQVNEDGESTVCYQCIHDVTLWRDQHLEEKE